MRIGNSEVPPDDGNSCFELSFVGGERGAAPLPPLGRTPDPRSTDLRFIFSHRLLVQLCDSHIQVVRDLKIIDAFMRCPSS